MNLLTFNVPAIFLIFLVMLFVSPSLEAHAASKAVLVEEYYVEYNVDGGVVGDVFVDAEFVELIVTMQTISDGVLEITIPRGLLDAKFEENDDIFFVIVDGFETDYIETATDVDSRTLAIPFFNGDSKVEVIGTKALSGPDLDKEEPDAKIPQWIRNNAQWWSEGSISDRDFLSGIQYLIDNDIMSIPASSDVTKSSPFVPNWIKDTAGWWASGKVGDSDFVNGVAWLVENGIIRV